MERERRETKRHIFKRKLNIVGKRKKQTGRYTERERETERKRQRKRQRQKDRKIIRGRYTRRD